MALSRTKLTQTLEDALMDIAMLEGDNAKRGEQLRDLRAHFLAIWEMAELGDKPEFETEVKVKVLRERAS